MVAEVEEMVKESLNNCFGQRGAGYIVREHCLVLYIHFLSKFKSFKYNPVERFHKMFVLFSFFFFFLFGLITDSGQSDISA